MNTQRDTGDLVELFARAGANARDSALKLRERIGEFPGPSITHEQIKELEQVGDRLTRDIVQGLLTGAAAPGDREDLYALAGAVDDVVDHVEHVSDLLDLYNVEAAMQQALDQCDVLARASSHLASAVADISDPISARELLTQIKQAEDEGDQLERRAIAALFESEQISPRVIIQWKDIFEGLEAAIDACEQAALTIGNMMMKRS